jgi:hypothetical protein
MCRIVGARPVRREEWALEMNPGDSRKPVILTRDLRRDLERLAVGVRPGGDERRLERHDARRRQCRGRAAQPRHIRGQEIHARDAVDVHVHVARDRGARGAGGHDSNLGYHAVLDSHVPGDELSVDERGADSESHPGPLAGLYQ